MGTFGRARLWRVLAIAAAVALPLDAAAAAVAWQPHEARAEQIIAVRSAGPDASPQTRLSFPIGYPPHNDVISDYLTSEEFLERALPNADRATLPALARGLSVTTTDIARVPPVHQPGTLFVTVTARARDAERAIYVVSQVTSQWQIEGLSVRGVLVLTSPRLVSSHRSRTADTLWLLGALSAICSGLAVALVTRGRYSRGNATRATRRA